MTQNITEDILKDYLTEKTNYSILLNGKWGSGKTYFLKNNLYEKIKKLNYTPLYVSLNGLSTIEELKKKIIAQLLISKDFSEQKKSKNNLIESSVRTIKNLFTNTSISNYIVNSLNPTDLFVLDNILFCFDDLERISSKLSYVEVFGYINSTFIEPFNHKCLFIGNEEEIIENVGKEYLKIKEKIIGISILFNQPLNDIINSLLKEYVEDKEYFNFLKKYESKLVLIFERTQEKNLRTISLFLNNLSKIFNSVRDIEQIEVVYEEIILFTAIVNIEYRGGRIKEIINSFNDLPNLIQKKGLNEINPNQYDLVGYAFTSLDNLRTDTSYTTLYSPLDRLVKKYNLFFPKIVNAYFKSIYYLVINSYLRKDILVEEVKQWIFYKTTTNQLEHDLVARNIFFIDYLSEIEFIESINSIVRFIEQGKYDIFEYQDLFMKFLDLQEEQILTHLSINEIEEIFKLNIEKAIEASNHFKGKVLPYQVRPTRYIVDNYPNLKKEIENFSNTITRTNYNLIDKEIKDSIDEYFSSKRRFVSVSIPWIIQLMIKQNNQHEIHKFFDSLISRKEIFHDFIRYIQREFEFIGVKQYTEEILGEIKNTLKVYESKLSNGEIVGVKRPLYKKLLSEFGFFISILNGDEIKPGFRLTFVKAGSLIKKKKKEKKKKKKSSKKMSEKRID